jgi:hypothetical protein
MNTNRLVKTSFRYVRITPGGDFLVVEQAKPIGFNELRSLVGGSIGGLRLRGVFAYVNGKTPAPDAEPNRMAMRLAQRDEKLGANETITSDMIVVGEISLDGEITSIPDAWIDSARVFLDV